MSDNFTRDRFEWLERLAEDSRIHSTAVRVALAISKYFNRDTGMAWPSIKTIAEASGTPERTVKHAISALCDAGHLEKRRGGFSKSNVYVMAGGSIKDPENAPEHSGAMGCPNDPSSEAMDCPNEASSRAMDCPSLGQWVAPRSGNGLPTNSLIEPSIKPYNIDISPPTPSLPVWKKGRGDDTDFDKFFEAYPRKVSKGTARKAWAKAVKISDAPTLIAAAQRYASERHGEDTRFTKHPASWLNAESWNDEPKAVPSREAVPIGFGGRSSAKERTAAAIQHMLANDEGDFQ